METDSCRVLAQSDSEERYEHCVGGYEARLLGTSAGMRIGCVWDGPHVGSGCGVGGSRGVNRAALICLGEEAVIEPTSGVQTGVGNFISMEKWNGLTTMGTVKRLWWKVIDLKTDFMF